MYNINEKTWTRLQVTGTIPSPRAAHSSCCIVRSNIVVFGGAKKNGGFTSNELYLLDLRNEKSPKWSILELDPESPKPQQRYGHSLIYYKPYLVLFGGVLKEKNNLSNELWICKIDYNTLFSSCQFKWEEVKYKKPQGPFPKPRLYHTTGVIKSGKAKGMIMLFGGRDSEQKALNDLWGLRRHRDNSWEWLIAPRKGTNIPLGRFQHTTLFYKNYLVVLGGRSENVEMCINGLPVEIYNSDKLQWHSIFSFDKFRHAGFSLDRYAFIHGGCDMTNFIEEPSDQIVMFDISIICSEQLDEIKSNAGVNNSAIGCQISTTTNNKGSSNSLFNGDGQFSGISIKPIIVNKADLSCITFTDENNNSVDEITPNISQDSLNGNISDNDIKSAAKSPNSSSLLHLQNEVKIISLDEKTKFQEIKPTDEEYFELYENFISNLLKPKEWKNTQKIDESIGFSKFKFRREHIIALTKACQEVVSSQPIVLRLSTPIKVFGDIHGQYDDLMRFFEFWGEPSEEPGVGDINSIDYLFLGDYVDRGVYSLETICLLMALKIKYPDKIHLLRGNHEDHLINYTFGFYSECEYRLSDDSMGEELNVFKVINEFFEYLPLVAIIENEIVCVHGGIGSSFTDISEVEKLQRPIPVIHEAITKQDQIVMDILWSDPTDSDDEKGIQPNVVRDTKSYGNIVKFGPDIVENFMEKNNVHMIIRAHECVPDGFERFCEGNLITVFSATDYCKRHQNAGAMLLITNNFEIIPYLIYPVLSGRVKWLDKGDFIKKRPPTPIRKRIKK